MASTRTPRRETSFVKRYREFLLSEQAAAWLYRELANVADSPDDAKTLLRLAEGEDTHAAHWASMLEKSHIEAPAFSRAPRRERTIAWFARRFGLQSVLPMLVRLEAADAGKYLAIPEAPESMSQEEVSHGRTLASIGKGAPGRIALIEARHRVRSGGALRAATFGINDGVVSNLALVMGVAGGTSNARVVLLVGIAAMFAGAFSMGAGEWISVRSQAELYEREIAIEKEELALFPEEETSELELIYRAKGVEEPAARRLAERIMLRPDAALDTLVREELGLDPSALGNPWLAAVSSFLAFAIGAFLPVIPFLFTKGALAIWISASIAAVVLVLVGLSISLFTGKSGIVSALRMLLVGAGAASITFGIGKLIGVSIS